MKKYRVISKKMTNGELQFYPQVKTFFGWMGLPHDVWYSNLKNAYLHIDALCVPTQYGIVIHPYPPITEE